MNLSSAAVNQLQKRLPKVINARTHGYLDYAHAAFFFGVGLALWHRNRRAAATALGTGAVVLAQSLLTDYPLGVKPVISFADHGKIDASLASASLVIPKLLGFSGTAAARIFETNAIVEGCIVGMTDYAGESPRPERKSSDTDFKIHKVA